MKAIQRGIMKILPGKMTEAMKLMEEWKAAVGRLGAPVEHMRMYRRLSGVGDVMHTIVFEVEWDSFAAMATFFDKVMTDPEMQTTTAKWDAVTENHELEILTPLP